MKIKGINKRQGEYNGIPYSNYQLFGIEKNAKNIDEWLMVKVSAKVVEDAGFKDYTLLINKEVEILYNRYGSVEKIRLVG